MTYILLILLWIGVYVTPTEASDTPTGKQVLQNIDRNMVFGTSFIKTTMNVINRRGNKLSFTSQAWSTGPDSALVEYLTPPRQKGVKMLKLGDDLWIYTPEPTDRIVTISGHMLRQSVNGSDLSYEDITESKSLVDAYDAVVTGQDTIDGSVCWVVELTARQEDVTYYSRKLWVDIRRWLPLKEERYARSGKLLKRTGILDLFQQDGRWIPRKMLFKDMLSSGQGTEYIIESIDFNVTIPAQMFTKAALRQ